MGGKEQRILVMYQNYGGWGVGGINETVRKKEGCAIKEWCVKKKR